MSCRFCGEPLAMQWEGGLRWQCGTVHCESDGTPLDMRSAECRCLERDALMAALRACVSAMDDVASGLRYIARRYGQLDGFARERCEASLSEATNTAKKCLSVE